MNDDKKRQVLRLIKFIVKEHILYKRKKRVKLSPKII